MIIVHVNVNVIRWNKKHNKSLPPCRVQEGSTTRYCREVIISGSSKMVYRPEKPLPCGAKLWVETDSAVELLDEIPYSTIRKEMENL